MQKKKKESPEQKLIPFERKDFIRQPNSISSLEFKMSLIQMRAFSLYVSALEPRFEEIIKGDLTTLFAGENLPAGVTIEKGMCWVNIFMRDLGITSQYYERARAALDEMKYIIISTNRREKNKEGERVRISGGVFFVQYPEGKTQKSKSIVQLGITQIMLESFCDMSRGYRDILKRIPFVSTNVYTVRMYMLVASKYTKKTDGTFTITMEDFRNFFDLYNYELDKKTGKQVIKGIKYARFAGLKNRVIIPALNELKELAETGNTDFYCEIMEDISKRGEPRVLTFKVIYTEVGKSFFGDKEKSHQAIQIEEMLKGKFSQTPANMKRIMKRLPLPCYTAFTKFCQELEKQDAKRVDIKDRKAYYWSVIDSWLTDHEPSVEELKETEDAKSTTEQLDLFKENDIHPNEKDVVDLTSSETNDKWKQFLAFASDKIGEGLCGTWLRPIKPIEITESSVTLGIPSKAFMECADNLLEGGLRNLLAEHFGEGPDIVFIVKPEAFA